MTGSEEGTDFACCDIRNFRMHVVACIDEVEAVVGPVRAKAVGPQGRARRGVTFVALSPPAPTAPLTVAWREDDASPPLRRFLDVIDAELARVGGASVLPQPGLAAA